MGRGEEEEEVGGGGGGEVTPAFQQSDNKQLLGEKMNLL